MVSALGVGRWDPLGWRRPPLRGGSGYSGGLLDVSVAQSAGYECGDDGTAVEAVSLAAVHGFLCGVDEVRPLVSGAVRP